eukprot:scaffold140_cov163-Amphora_coffeaeformis.AAC.15
MSWYGRSSSFFPLHIITFFRCGKKCRQPVTLRLTFSDTFCPAPPHRTVNRFEDPPSPRQ